MSSVPAAASGATAHKLSERARTQRQRILTAAAKCFVASGFHAASIADIAAEAEMSQGLIYRYFESKSAIVQAIIGTCLEREASKVIDQLESPEDVVKANMDIFSRRLYGEDFISNAALLLEMTAECTRDRHIAAAARRANDYVRTHLREMLKRYAKKQGLSLSASALRGRVLILQTLYEGLAMRAIREPELDRAALKTALKEVVIGLMSR